MKEKIKIYIVLIILTGILLGGFLIWENHQKTERKYQACLEKCDAKYPSKLDLTAFGGVDEKVQYNVCMFECKEKYAK